MKRQLVMISIGPALFLLLLMIWGRDAWGVQFTFEPRLSVSEEYSDNIFLTDDNPESDFVTTITPGFTAQVLTRRSGAELAYDPGYAIYADFNENDTWRHAVDFRAWTELSRDTRLEITDRFLRTEDPLSEEEIETMREQEVVLGEAPTVRVGRQPYITNTAAINLNHRIGRYSAFDMGYAYRLLNNDDPQVLDNQSHNAFAALAYWPTVRIGLVPRVEYLRGIYEDEFGSFNNYLGSLALVYRFTRHLEGFVQYAQTYRDYDTEVPEVENFHVYDPSMGVRYQVSESILVSGEAGYFLQDNEHSSSEGGYHFDAEGTWETERTLLGLEAGHGYDRAELGSENLGLTRYTRVRFRGEYALTRYVTVDAFAGYRKSEYLDRPEGGEDDFYRGGVGLDYQIFEWMFVRLQYDYNRVNSTIERNDYTENRGLLRVTLTPTQPWRWVK